MSTLTKRTSSSFASRTDRRNASSSTTTMSSRGRTRSKTSCCSLATPSSCGRPADMTSTPTVKPTSRAAFVFAIAATVAVGATQLSAQSSGSQGGGASDQSAQKLNITLSSTGAHDSDTSPEARAHIGLGDPGVAGYSTMLVGTADYLVQSRRVQFRATDTSTLRYYRPLEVLSSY